MQRRGLGGVDMNERLANYVMHNAARGYANAIAGL